MREGRCSSVPIHASSGTTDGCRESRYLRLRGASFPKCDTSQHSETTMYRRILAAIDGSETSIRALDEALRLARENHAERRSLYIVDAPLMVTRHPATTRRSCAMPC